LKTFPFLLLVVFFFGFFNYFNVHRYTLQHRHFTGYPVVNDPLYNHEVFGPSKGKGGDIGGKTDEQLVRDLINIHNAENWLGIDGDSELSMFNKSMGSDLDDSLGGPNKGENKPAEIPKNLHLIRFNLSIIRKSIE
jgi:hypothetical protein